MPKKVCLSTHRFLRDSPAKVDAPSESSEESLDQMAETIQKYLSPKDADDVKKIISDINSAKDSEQNVDRDYVRLDTIFEFGLIYETLLHPL